MIASELFQDIFNFLKNNQNFADISVEFPNSSTTLNKGVVCITLVRDALTGIYETQDFSGIEISLNFFSANFKEISGKDNFEEKILKLLKTYNKVNFHLVKRFFPIFVSEISLYNSSQVYRCYFQYDRAN
jgi:hypothetical protein